jgi:hypothetical protein
VSGQVIAGSMLEKDDKGRGIHFSDTAPIVSGECNDVCPLK